MFDSAAGSSGGIVLLLLIWLAEVVIDDAGEEKTLGKQFVVAPLQMILPNEPSGTSG